MRTTVTLDPDVEALIKRAVRKRGEPFKKVLNGAIRRGLRAPVPANQAFRQKTHDLGPARVDLTKALSLSAEFDDQASLNKLARGR